MDFSIFFFVSASEWVESSQSCVDRLMHKKIIVYFGNITKDFMWKNRGKSIWKMDKK